MTLSTQTHIDITSPKSVCTTGYEEDLRRALSLADHAEKEKRQKSISSSTPFRRPFWREISNSIPPLENCDGNDVPCTRTLLTDEEDSLEESNQILEQKLPSSTPMERKRFLTGRSLKRVVQKMELYFEWREQYKLDEASYSQRTKFESDGDAWDFAVEHTSRYYDSPGASPPSKLSRIIKFGEIDDLYALDGRRIAQVLPGLIDKKLATLDFYARCVGVFLNLKLDRNSDESIYVMVDVRSGLNWPNLSPTALLPFVKSLNRQLIKAMPERMHRTFVYPIPPIAKPIWALFKNLLDKKIAAKISILWGGAGTSSPIPKGMLNEVFDAHIVESLEGIRCSEFSHPEIER